MVKGAGAAAALGCWRGLLLGAGLQALSLFTTPPRAYAADPIALTQSTRPASPAALAETEKETPRSRIRLREGGVRVWSRAVAGEPKSDLLALSYALDGVDLSHGKRHVDHVAPEGTVRPLGTVGPAGGDGGVGGLLDIGSGVLAWLMAYVGGPNWAKKFFPYVPGTPAPRLKLIECSHLPLLRYFNGRELITHCPTDSYSEGEPC